LFCEKYGIKVIGYAPLARGGTDVKVKYGNQVDLFNNDVIKKIAEKHNKSVA
jgi:diketogulonate reductase-like aldo/keto reductase